MVERGLLRERGHLPLLKKFCPQTDLQPHVFSCCPPQHFPCVQFTPPCQVNPASVIHCLLPASISYLFSLSPHSLSFPPSLFPLPPSPPPSLSPSLLLPHPFPPSSLPSLQLIEKYVHQTHAKTHNHYTLTVQEVFNMDKHGENEKFKDVGNRYIHSLAGHPWDRRKFPY